MIGGHAGLLACVALSGLLILGPVPALAQGNVAIIPIDRPMWVLKRANTRSGPGTSYDKVGLMDSGQKVRATGEAGNWIRIQFASGRTAFIYAPLLSATPPAGQSQAAKPRTQVITGSNARYEGEVRNGKPHGQGTIVWNDGDRYEGEFVDGNRTGQGTYTWSSGNRYNGGWQNGEHHGRGTKTWTDGRQYEGDWQAGKQHGRGLWIGADGAYYEGDWQASKWHGQGSRFWSDGSRYEGGWRDDKMHGQGIMTYSNGDLYAGTFRHDKPHGQGVLILVDGRRYGGEWRNGCFGKRGGRWAALETSTADCGFK